MVKINDIAKPETVFEGTKTIDITNLVNVDIGLMAVARLKGNFGEFIVLKVKKKSDGEVLVFTTGAKVLMQKVSQAVRYFNKTIEEDARPVDFPETVEGKIILVKTEKGTSYYDFVND